MFAGQLQRCRFAHIDELSDAEQVLLLGDGNGRFSTELLKQFPAILITSLDASDAMLKQAKQRRKKAGLSEDRIQNLHQNALEWTDSGASYDAVVAQFFFDSFGQDDLNHIASSIRNCLYPDGKLFVSEFHIPNDTRLGNWRARILLRCLYGTFRIITGLKTQKLEDYESILSSHGFHLKSAIYFSQKSLVSQVFEKNAPSP